MLVVDLDGTLLRSDMLHESFWSALSDDPRTVLGSIAALREGKPQLKRYLANRITLDPSTLPYDPRVIEALQDWRLRGGRTALVTATDAALAQVIADHLGLFDAVAGSSEGVNLKGPAKAAYLQQTYGDAGYVYMGDSAADLPVWDGADAAISVGAAPKTRAALDAQGGDVTHIPSLKPYGPAILAALRPRQWLKNLLVFVPMLADLHFSPAALIGSMLAFVALSLVASSGYVFNDLLDLADDRSHPRKRHRAFAAGDLSAATGTALAPALLLLGLLVAWLVGPLLAGAVALYFVATIAYSVKLKRHSMVDICMLATLFTLRIIAGGVAIGVALSVWLLAFSMFIFFSLAAVKRLAEMTDVEAADRAVSRRAYGKEDRGILSQIAVTSGYLSVLVLALYIDEPIVREKFSTPWLLWGVCPLLIFWVSRMVMIAGRGEMQDDPLVYALENKTSQKVLLFSFIFIFAAIVL